VAAVELLVGFVGGFSFFHCFFGNRPKTGTIMEMIVKGKKMSNTTWFVISCVLAWFLWPVPLYLATVIIDWLDEKLGGR
jgi:hypothetical protein